MSNTKHADPTISPEEVAARRDDEDLFILDVRNEGDYEEWQVENSHNLPIYDELLDGKLGGLEDALDDIPTDKEIAIVCVAGITSAHAAEFLRERGYDAKSMDDGMNGWGRVHVTYELEDVDGVTQIVRPGTGCLSYLVYDGDEGVVVDPSLYLDEYRSVADDHDVEIVAAVDTHAHADHVSGGRPLAAELDVPYYLHPTDAADLDEYAAIEDGDTIAVGDRELEVMHTPGHTPGSVSLTWDDALLSGDTLFIRSVGRPDLEGSDETDVREAAAELFDSLDRLTGLSDETVVLPGHMSDEEIRPLATTLGDLEADNELVAVDDRTEFVETIVDALSDEPANYNQIKAINWGKEPLTDEAADLELGPNNCAAS
ncbi:MBL fold metallo-hydrolase [Natrinema halophilum]|uniref:MBL fold metallo-hydrolase n=1 Tax=Natrinema halophilum TaxID=1699371 RepID=A0A7D5KKS4_9EURY|nr:MBL fold metallo-hydrolase [Natrinema halophilum]QLG49298.1 MBL fold metallo-hydrolase [Natrinema halophilum]